MSYDNDDVGPPTIAEPRTGEVLPMPMEAPDFARQQLQIGSADMGFIMSAQRIQVPRKPEGQIRAQLANLCAQNGDQYLYSWEVNDRVNKRRVTIEGLTIKGAMDLARVYGNCFAGVVGLKDMNRHWLFQAAWIDLETGFNVRRDFLQRKGQETGMRDADRQMDIVFQIGQSKAIRNAVVQANPSAVEFMIEESKKRMVKWITDNREKAENFVNQGLAEFGIDQARVEAVIGRGRKEWTVRDLARVMKELRGVYDGLVNAADLYPSETDAAKVAAEKAEKREKGAAKQEAKPKPEAKEGAAPTITPSVKTAQAEVAKNDPRLAVEVAKIESFGTRTKNALAKAKKTHIGHVVQQTPDKLLALDGFGEKCLTEVKAYLAEHGLALGMKLVEAGPESAEPDQAQPKAEPEPEPGEEDEAAESGDSSDQNEGSEFDFA